LPLALLFVIAGVLIWTLLRPTAIALCAAALYWSVQAVKVRLADGSLYSVRLGLGFDFRVTDNPSYTVSLNFLAIASAALYVTAALRHAERGRPPRATA